MDKATLFEIHQQRLEREENNDDNMEQIVQLLGGIDSILLNYLKSNDIAFDISKESIKELHTLIAAPPKTLIITSADTSEFGSVDNIRKIRVALNLESDNNLLHSLVKPHLYNRILFFLHHKLTLIFLLFSMLLWAVFIATKNVLLWNIYIICMAILFWIPYCLFWLLSVNKVAFYYVLKSFDFWIKVVYMFIWGVSELAYRFGLQDIEKSGIDAKYYGLSLFTYILFDITAMLSLIIISSFDGFETKKIWTIIISAAIAVLTLGFSFAYQFDRIRDGDDSVIVMFNVYEFSLKRIMANAQRVVGIFLAKQTYHLFRNRKKATSINIKPKLLWIKSKSNVNINQQKSISTNVRDDGLQTAKHINNTQFLKVYN